MKKKPAHGDIRDLEKIGSSDFKKELVEMTEQELTGGGKMKRSRFQDNVDVKKMKMEIAEEYGVKDFEDIDRGNLTSRANGDITRTLVEMSEKAMQDGIVPGTLKGQNLGHNSKRESLGPNTKRK